MGCVGYWLLTGHNVFRGETPIKTMMMHINDAQPPPSARSELAIPTQLDHVILCCLEKDPEARPQSAAELSQRLNGILLDRPRSSALASGWWDQHINLKKRVRAVPSILEPPT